MTMQPVTNFDFWTGEWGVHHRKLADTLDPTCEEWIEFEGSITAATFFDGQGSFDTGHLDAPTPMQGMSLRLYDPQADLWRIWWASTRFPGRLDPPVEGRFTDGVGIFECDDVLGDVKIRVRYEWTVQSAHQARWRQFFSYDGGATWVLNWIMEMTRRG